MRKILSLSKNHKHGAGHSPAKGSSFSPWSGKIVRVLPAAIGGSSKGACLQYTRRGQGGSLHDPPAAIQPHEVTIPSVPAEDAVTALLRYSLCRHRFALELEGGTIQPHAVKDNGEFSCHGHLGFVEAGALCQIHAP